MIGRQDIFMGKGKIPSGRKNIPTVSGRKKKTNTALKHRLIEDIQGSLYIYKSIGWTKHFNSITLSNFTFNGSCNKTFRLTIRQEQLFNFPQLGVKLALQT